MIRSLSRRAVVVTLAVVAGIGVSTLFAAAASAHTVSVQGFAQCPDASGKWVVTWAITNNYNTTGAVVSATLNPADPVAKVPTTVPARTTAYFNSTVEVGKADSVSLNVAMVWPDGYRESSEASVRLNLPCPTDSPTPPHSPSPSPSHSSSLPPSHPTESTPTPSPATPSLPVTGSDTTLPMIGTGAGLVTAGGVVLFLLRRRRRVTFTAE